MKRNIPLLLILLAGLFLRIIYPNGWLHFEMDEEVIAWKTMKFWRDGEPFLIGGGTPFGVHLGPAFYYLSALPLVFTRGDPIGWIVFTSLVSILTFYLIWLVGKTLYSRTVGLVAATLWAFSFTTVMLDRHWWPLVLDPLFSLLALLSLFHILHGRQRWWIVLGLTLAFAWQTDLTNLVLFVGSGMVFAIRLKRDWKFIGFAAGIVALSFLPLVIFELRHPGANLGQFNLIRPGPAFAGPGLLKSIPDLSRFIPSTLASLLIPNWRSSDLSDWYTWCKDVAASRTSSPPIMMMIATGILLYPVVRWFRKKEISDLSLAVVMGSGIVGISIFRFFGGDLFDFYLAPLFPAFIIALSVASVAIGMKIFKPFSHVAIPTILVLIFIINVRVVLNTQHVQGLVHKQDAVAWVTEQVNDRPFAVESLSRCHRYNGIRYLFMLDGHEPVMSFMDPNYSWLYDDQPETAYPDLFVAFVTPQDLTAADETRYNELKRRAINSKQFGDFDVVIADNRDHAFSIDF